MFQIPVVSRVPDIDVTNCPINLVTIAENAEFGKLFCVYKDSAKILPGRQDLLACYHASLLAWLPKKMLAWLQGLM